MDIKPRPNHALYIQTLRCMTPSQRLHKAFELSDFTRRLFISGLRAAFPDYNDEQFAALVRDRLAKCHNRND